MIDFRNQLLDAAERPPADCLLSNDVEPDFHLVEPGRTGRGEVDVIPRTSRQPLLHSSMFMRPIVIDDKMNLQVAGDVGLHMIQELQVLLMSVPLFAPGDYFARGDVQSGKQGRCPMADIVMGHALDIAQPDGEDGLGSIQGLNLAFFVDTEDHGLFGRVEIQPDDIADLFDEERVGRDLEMALPMGLETEGLPDAVNGGPRDGDFLGHGADRPMGAVLRFRLNGFLDELGDSFIGNRAGTPGPQFIMKARDSLILITAAPSADGVGTIVDFPSDFLIREAISGHDDDSGSGDQTMRERAGTGERLKLFSLLLRQSDVHFFGPACSHGYLHYAHDTADRLYMQLIYETIH